MIYFFFVLFSECLFLYILDMKGKVLTCRLFLECFLVTGGYFLFSRWFVKQMLPLIGIFFARGDLQSPSGWFEQWTWTRIQVLSKIPWKNIHKSIGIPWANNSISWGGQKKLCMNGNFWKTLKVIKLLLLLVNANNIVTICELNGENRITHW